jgi:leucyl-tRNA synthetase
MYKAREIEKKWQDKWEASKIFEADPDPKKAKKFITIPYPYASGTMHIGHGRSYVNGDIFARYYRAKDYNVLFPMAFHITGTPVLAISSSLERGDKETFEKMCDYVGIHTSNNNEINKIVESFVDPWNIVNYFSEKMKVDLKSIGMSLDWRREFTTGDKIYNQFIEWQYYKIKEKGYLEKGEYPILYCPRCMNAVGEDDIARGDELDLSINEYTCIKFPFEEGYLVPATLRPETIYGVTNIWINPKGQYVKAEINGEILYISKEATHLLENQNKRVKVIQTFKGIDLVGKNAKHIISDRILPILPGDFVDTSAATGVVYSVPAHAPFDYIALIDLQNDTRTIQKYNLDEESILKIQPIKIIELEAINDIPAKYYCEKFHVNSQMDKEKLDSATTENYRAEFYNGILNERCDKYMGKSVSEAVDLVIKDLMEENKADKIYIPLTKGLECRCGEQIIVSILKDQWFLNFNAGNWKEMAFKCLNEMTIHPKKYRTTFENVFNWLEKRPCARKRGLGTQLPFDKEWIIESLSDSTIYMSFYTIAHHIKQNHIESKQLTPNFFDFLYLKKGNIEEISKDAEIDQVLLKRMQKEFNYWYPVDHRHTAIMHISNHLSFYIFHHVAIFPEFMWPQTITLIEPLIIEGQKMGKSKGNIISLADIKEKYSADLFRLYISHSADLGINIDWKEKEVQVVRNHIDRFYKFMKKSIENKKDFDLGYDDIKSDYTKVVISKITSNFLKIDDALEYFNLRRYLQLAFYETFNLMQEANKNLGSNTDFQIIFKLVYEDWLKILSLAVPHLCEELWELSNHQDFISKSIWGEFNTNYIDNNLEMEFEYISQLLDDISKVRKVIKATNINEIYVYTAPKWKNEVLEIVKSKKGDFNSIISELKTNSTLIKNKKSVPFIKDLIKKRSWDLVTSVRNESETLKRYKSYIEGKVKSKIIIDSKFDPESKLDKALPNKPALYINIEK